MLKRWASLLPLSASPGLANRKQYKREIETSSQIGTATENAFVEVSGQYKSNSTDGKWSKE
jgi:hypothetical protein